ncbi:MAG: hypothetical protein ABEI13_01565 [Candidatus Paceibacteria bacterium]
MSEVTRLTIRIEQSQKEKWANHADHYDQYQSRTGLIKQAVERQIAEDRDEVGYGDLSQLIDSIEELDRQLSEIKRGIDSIEDQQLTRVNLDALADEIKRYYDQEVDE